MAKFEQNLSKSILDSGFVLHIMIPRSIIFSFFVLKSGKDSKLHQQLDTYLFLNFCTMKPHQHQYSSKNFLHLHFYFILK